MTSKVYALVRIGSNKKVLTLRLVCNLLRTIRGAPLRMLDFQGFLLASYVLSKSLSGSLRQFVLSMSPFKFSVSLVTRMDRFSVMPISGGIKE